MGYDSKKKRWSAADVNAPNGELEIAVFSPLAQKWVRACMEGGYLYTVSCKVSLHLPVYVKAPPIEDAKYPLYMDVMRALRSRGYSDIRDG